MQLIYAIVCKVSENILVEMALQIPFQTSLKSIATTQFIKGLPL